MALWEEEAAQEQRREDCKEAEREHRADKTRYSTPIETWDKSTDPPSCTKMQYMYEGVDVNPNDQTGVDKAREDQQTEQCNENIVNTSLKNNGIYTSKREGEVIEGCGEDRKFWFYSGDIKYSEDQWIEANNTMKKNACTDDLDKALKNTDKYGRQYTPKTPKKYSSPDPCGKPYWLCEGVKYDDYDTYKEQSACAKRSKPEDKEPSKEIKKKLGDKKTQQQRCKNFKPDPRCGNIIKKTSPVCRCR